MASQSISQPNARTFSVVDLVAEVRRGRVRVPEFQRPLRWQWEDVRRLFDSIVKGYPVGNLLLWQRHAPAARITLGALSFAAPEFSDGWWVVDGQQRLTSLANALGDEAAGDPRFAMAYDLREGSFCHLPSMEDPFVVPLPILFDLSRLFRWIVEHPEAQDKLDDASRVTKAIREFSIPAYVVEQQDEAVLRDIYDRMNNYGKRLSRAEVFSALHPGEGENGAPRSSFETIIAAIERERGFGQIDDDTILRAVLARRSGNVNRDIRVEFSEQARKDRDFGDEAQETAYQEGERAILRAIDFLQADAGVPHFTFLPYRYLLVILARFFAHFPEPEPRNRALLRRWFWRAAMLGPAPFSNSWTEAMRVLAMRIVPEEETGSVQRLLQAPMEWKPKPPNLTQFNTRKAESRVVLCALWSLRPRSFATGEAYSRQDLSEAISEGGTLGQVVGRILSREPEGHRAWAANRLFVLEEPTGSVADLLLVAPEDLAPGTKYSRPDVLASHALTEELADALSRRDLEYFLEGRQALIQAATDDFLARTAELEFEDTPPLDSLDLDDDGARDDA